MAHSHTHDGESVRDYFTEQLLTILVCGLLGFAAVQMYRTDRLGLPRRAVPRAGALRRDCNARCSLVLRAIAVWKEAGEMQPSLRGADSRSEPRPLDPDCNHTSLPRARALTTTITGTATTCRGCSPGC